MRDIQPAARCPAPGCDALSPRVSLAFPPAAFRIRSWVLAIVLSSSTSCAQQQAHATYLMRWVREWGVQGSIHTSEVRRWVVLPNSVAGREKGCLRGVNDSHPTNLEIGDYHFGEKLLFGNRPWAWRGGAAPTPKVSCSFPVSWIIRFHRVRPR